MNVISFLNIETNTSILLNGNTGLVLYCATFKGACGLLYPKEKKFKFLNPGTAMVCTSEKPLIKNIDNVIINHTNIIEQTSSPLDTNIKLPYTDYINFGYENGKINLTNLFGQNKEMEEKYIRSFEPALNYVIKEIKAGTITIDMEEFGWTIPIFGHHVLFVSRFLKLLTSLYRYNSGYFNSKFASLLQELMTADIPNVERINKIELLTDAINTIPIKYKNLDQILETTF